MRLIDGSSPGSVMFSGKLQTKARWTWSGRSGSPTASIRIRSRRARRRTTRRFNAPPYQAVTPTWSQLKTYGPTYTYNGATYTAATITSPLNAAPAAANITTNPLRIYYCATDLAVFSTGTGNITLTGSLVVNGKLLVGASGNVAIRSLTINPVSGTSTTSGAPRVGREEQRQLPRPGKTITVNGISWLGEGLTGDLAANSPGSFIVNGGCSSPRGRQRGRTVGR